MLPNVSTTEIIVQTPNATVEDVSTLKKTKWNSSTVDTSTSEGKNTANVKHNGKNEDNISICGEHSR